MSEPADGHDLEAQVRGIPEPREHHYVFAHVALPSVVFSLGPELDLEGLAADAGFTRALWGQVGERVGAGALVDEGLAAQYAQDGELDAMIVTLPEARFVTEAILVAVVRRTKRRMLLWRERELRYFTLEVGVDFDDAGQLTRRRTVLCEWTPEPRHLNYDTGPEARVDAFLTAVLERCRER